MDNSGLLDWNLKQEYINKVEKFYIQDGCYVFNILNEMKRTYLFSYNQFRDYIMEINRVLINKDVRYQIINRQSFFTEFSFRNLDTQIPLDLDTENKLINLAYSLYELLIFTIISNDLYLSQEPTYTPSKGFNTTANCYRIGDYTSDTIILYKYNPWSTL